MFRQYLLAIIFSNKFIYFLRSFIQKVLQGSGSNSLAQQSLVRAKESQNRVLKRISFEQPSNLEEQKTQFCTICKLLGDVADRPNEIDFAIRSLKEALEIRPEDWQSLIVLAKLFMKVFNDFSFAI